MDIDTDSLVTFIIMWGTPTFMMVRAYLKMSTEDKKSAMSDFRSWRFISTIGFVSIGVFFVHLGALLSVSIIKAIGIGLLIFGSIFSTLNLWKTSKMRSIFIFVLLSFVIFINVT